MKFILPILLGLAHALNDFLSGYILAVYTRELSTKESAAMLLLYAVLAFGGQIPVALWLTKRPYVKTATLMALAILLLGAAISYSHLPVLVVTIIGLASAMLHVAGGTWVLKLEANSTGMTGLFVAPGVAGLSLGGFLGSQAVSTIPFIVIVAVLVLFVFILIASKKYKSDLTPEVTKSVTTVFERHDALMLLILAAICLRSLLWDIINLFYGGNNHLLLLIIGLSAFLGKILGGYITDALGWKRWLRISLPMATLLLAFLGDNPVALCTGAALLQSTTPMMIQLMYSVFPAEPAIAVALSLGLGVLLAGIPAYLPFFTENIHVVLVIVCVGLPFYGWWLLRRL